MTKEKEKNVRLALRDFIAYSRDLLDSKFQNFGNNLKIFIDFCETNDIMKTITEPLKLNSKVNLKDWWEEFSKTGGSFVGSKHYELPVNEEDRTALLYQFLVALNNGVYDFLTFTTGVYGNRRCGDDVTEFNDDITKKLVRGLNNRLDEIELKPNIKEPSPKISLNNEKIMEWDLFISHASEDKEKIARPLAEALRKEGFKVWYDEFTLKIGDSLRRSIDYGLANSRYGLVILSPNFLRNNGHKLNWMA